MKTLHLAAATLIAIALPHVAHAERIEAQLSGYSEVPSVSTPASGEFKATIARDGQSIDYELTFSGLTGTVQQSHIHIAQRGVNGSIVVWLCQTPTTPAPAAVSIATPMCPQAGTVSGTITSSSVIAASTASQLIAARRAQRSDCRYPCRRCLRERARNAARSWRRNSRTDSCR